MPTTKFLLFLCFAGSLYGVTTITGCNVSANKQGSTNQAVPCTLTISPASNVALVGAGSLSCTTACTSTVFTPPTNVTAGQVRSGCQVSPIDSIWNTRIDNLPIHAKNATWMAYLAANMGGYGLFTPALAADTVDNSTPTTTYLFHYSPTYNGVAFPKPVRPDLGREGGTMVYSSIDHYWGRINKQTCNFYETYQDGVSYAGSGDPTATAGSALIWNGTSYDLPISGQQGTTAGGFPRIPLTWDENDIKNGPTHPIESVMPGGYIALHLNNWPSTIGTFSGCGDLVNCVPYGAWFRLNATWLAANLANYSPYAQSMLVGLNHYGSPLVDASSGGLQFEMDPRAYGDPVVAAAIQEFVVGLSPHPIPLSAFEFIDPASLMVSATSSRINPANAYVTPTTSSVLTVSNGSNPTVILPIAVTPVTIGTTYPLFGVIAGTAGQQLDSWVNGSTNTAVTWSLASGTGAVTAGGIYTPASSTVARATDVLTITSSADGTVTTPVLVTVLPKDAAHVGGFAVDVAGNGGTVGTGLTRTYLADGDTPQGGKVTYPYGPSGGDYPAWTGISDALVWNSSWHVSGTLDLVLGPYMVPNGNYRVTFMNGQGNPGGCSGLTATMNVTTYTAGLDLGLTPVALTANGQVAGVVDFGLLSAYKCRQTNIYTIPAKVTNGFLLVAMRMMSTGQSSPVGAPNMNGAIIDPDAVTTPLWTMDKQLADFVAPGKTLQLRQVDWWTGSKCPGPDGAASNSSCTWTSTGPGSVSNMGLYTAPSSQAHTATATVTVTNGTYTAKTSFYVPGTASPVAIFH